MLSLITHSIHDMRDLPDKKVLWKPKHFPDFNESAFSNEKFLTSSKNSSTELPKEIQAQTGFGFDIITPATAAWQTWNETANWMSVFICSHKPVRPLGPLFSTKPLPFKEWI